MLSSANCTCLALRVGVVVQGGVQPLVVAVVVHVRALVGPLLGHARQLIIPHLPHVSRVKRKSTWPRAGYRVLELVFLRNFAHFWTIYDYSC